MSDSQAYEKVTVGADGVTVTKRFEEDEFPVPAIAFEFVSEREEEVSVRLVDQVPEGVAVEDLGFHPEYGSEYWTIDEETITFERDLGANSAYTTVYGIRATGADDVAQFLTEPTIEEVDPPLPEAERTTGDGEVVPEGDVDAVRDAIAGEGDVPGLEDEEADDEEIETLDLKDPNAPEDGTEATDSGGESGGDGSTATVEGSIVSAMASEIRSNDVSVDDLKLLHRAFEKVAEQTDSTDGSTEARLRRVQSDVADLRAYTDSLEEFLDENGRGDELIEDFQSQLSEFADELEGLQQELAENSSTVSQLETAVDDIGTEVEDIGSEVDGVSEDVESVSGDVADMESSVGELDDAIEELQGSVEELESQVGDGEITGRIENIESELESLQEWQDQIKSTFGG